MTQHTGTPEKKARNRQTTVHLKFTGEVLEQLDEMAGNDRRDRPDFIRLLVEDEWKRRKGNGAQP